MKSARILACSWKFAKDKGCIGVCESSDITKCKVFELEVLGKKKFITDDEMQEKKVNYV